jgi:hypothetical protein
MKKFFSFLLIALIFTSSHLSSMESEEEEIDAAIDLMIMERSFGGPLRMPGSKPEKSNSAPEEIEAVIKRENIGKVFKSKSLKSDSWDSTPEEIEAVIKRAEFLDAMPGAWLEKSAALMAECKVMPIPFNPSLKEIVDYYRGDSLSMPDEWQ